MITDTTELYRLFDEEAKTFDPIIAPDLLTPVYFRFNNANLDPQAESAIQQKIALLQLYTNWTMLIRGHADSRGDSSFNEKLGLQRANVVRDYILSLDSRIAPSQIEVMSHGEDRPVDTRRSFGGWARNRRVDFIINRTTKRAGDLLQRAINGQGDPLSSGEWDLLQTVLWNLKLSNDPQIAKLAYDVDHISILNDNFDKGRTVNKAVIKVFFDDDSRPLRFKLKAGRRARLRVQLSLPDILEIKDEEASRLHAFENEQFTIRVICTSCEENKPLNKNVLFSEGLQLSTIAEFDIIPQVSDLTSIHDGLKIQVWDQQGSNRTSLFIANLLKPGSGLAQDSRFRAWLGAPGNRTPHVIFDIYEGEEFIEVDVRPTDQRLRDRINNVMGNHVDVWPIETNLRYAGLLEKHRSLFLQLVEIGANTNRKYVKGRRITEEESHGILSEIRNLTEPIYQGFFQRDQDTALLLNTIERFGEALLRTAEPMRILVRTDKAFFPWHMLYERPIDANSDSIDPFNFWGFKYELTVQLYGIYDPYESAPLLYPDASEIIFARYREGNDSATEGANAFESIINSTFPANQNNGLRVVDSAEDFVEAIISQKNETSLILAYAHASSGEYVDTTRKQPVFEQLKTRIQFSSQEALETDKLDSSLQSYSLEQGILPHEMLKKFPIVFLNGCETGPPPRATGYKHFAGIFLSYGARSAIVTEAQIRADYALDVGEKLLGDITKTQVIPFALWKARTDLLMNPRNHNPYGLFYSYYGSPAATVSPPP